MEIYSKTKSKNIKATIRLISIYFCFAALHLFCGWNNFEIEIKEILVARFLVKHIYPYTKLSHDLAEIDCVKVFRETISKKNKIKWLQGGDDFDAIWSKKKYAL